MVTKANPALSAIKDALHGHSEIYFEPTAENMALAYRKGADDFFSVVRVEAGIVKLDRCANDGMETSNVITSETLPSPELAAKALERWLAR